MSSTIAINDLKFTIFGSGHDYTLADSGKGGVRVFSHPYVPLDSVHYAGMWYFTVPDENGETMDAVKDDLAHCEFTPALGATFDTEGEVSLECHYHREYIYDEETVIVDKTAMATVTVVDHGTVTQQAYWDNSRNKYVRCDLYSDGYGFIRPFTTTEVLETYYYASPISGIKKCSSIPWRAKYLGSDDGINSFLNGQTVTDISELAYADVSNVTKLYLLYNTYVTDISAIADWDTSNVDDMSNLFAYCSKLADLSPLLNWNTSKVARLYSAFQGCNSLVTLHGLENWDVSNVTDITWLLASCSNLTDISALANWNTSKVTSLEATFAYIKLTDISPLANWDVSKVTNLNSTFRNSRLSSFVALSNWNPKPTSMYAFCSNSLVASLDGLENFDTSNCTDMIYAFIGNYYLTDCSAIADWDVSKVRTFDNMFNGCWWLSDVSFLNDWDIRGSCGMMMYGANIRSLAGVNLDLSHVTNYSGMFNSRHLYYSSKQNLDVVEISSIYYDRTGKSWTGGEIDDYDHPLVEYVHDASNAENWSVNGTGLYVFNTDVWSNAPSWNASF